MQQLKINSINDFQTLHDSDDEKHSMENSTREINAFRRHIFLSAGVLLHSSAPSPDANCCRLKRGPPRHVIKISFGVAVAVVKIGMGLIGARRFVLSTVAAAIVILCCVGREDEEEKPKSGRMTEMTFPLARFDVTEFVDVTSDGKSMREL